MSVNIKEIIETLENIIPIYFQEDYDNCGLQVGNKSMEITSALISLDITTEVIDEAVNNNCNLIISHHPVIFYPVKNIIAENNIGNIIIKAIKNNVALYSMHTNLDNSYDGLNKYVAEKLGLFDIKILAPKQDYLKKIVTYCPTNYVTQVREALFNAGAGHIGNYDNCSFNSKGSGTFRALEGTNPFTGNINETFTGDEIKIETVFPAYLENKILKALFNSHPYEEVAYDIYKLSNKFDKAGSGVSGSFEKPYNETNFIEHLKKIFNIPFIRHNKMIGRKIQNISLCTGSGSFLINNAINNNSDAFITADLKYHNFTDAGNKIFLTDCGHFETEIFAKEIIRDILIKKFPNFAVLISKNEINPVNYS